MAPWRLHQNYPRDVLLMRHGRLTDEGVRFARAGAAVDDSPAVPAVEPAARADSSAADTPVA